MSKKHPQRMIDAGISPARYQELINVCRQYPAYVLKIRRARAGIVDRPRRKSGAWKRPDPTGNAAASIADSCAWESDRVRVIERCAKEAGPPGVTGAILRSVTEGRTWEQLLPPCGRNQFYDYRMWFYILLDNALKNWG